MKSAELFTLLRDLRADKENGLKGIWEPGHDLPDHLLGDPVAAFDYPIRPREAGTNFWDEGSRRWIMAALSTTMDQTYEDMRFLVQKFLQLSSPRARRLVEAFPVLRAFMWTEYLRVCNPDIPVQRDEFRELLTFDHDSFYREGSTHDRDHPGRYPQISQGQGRRDIGKLQLLPRRLPPRTRTRAPKTRRCRYRSLESRQQLESTRSPSRGQVRSAGQSLWIHLPTQC